MSAVAAVTIRPGSEDDASAIRALLVSCAGDCVAESEDWIRQRVSAFRVAESASGAIVAAAAALRASARERVLRAVAVSAGCRGQGLSRRVLGPLLGEADDAGLSLWCRTARPEFFSRYAFRSQAVAPGPDGRARHVMLRAPRTKPNSTEVSMTTNVLDSEPEGERRKPAAPLFICRAGYPEMSIAADIIRSTASWYRPFLDPDDMGEHDIGPDWGPRNFHRREFFLGWIGADPVGVLSVQETGDYLYLGYVYLQAGEVGNGYGRRLLEFARKLAIHRGKRGLALIAHPKAKWATRAYERFGFRAVATEREDVLEWNEGWLAPYYEEGFHLYKLSLEQG